MKAPMKQSKTPAASDKPKRVTFLLTAAPNSEVFIAGTMNNWNPKQHKMKDTRNNGKYTITLMLPKGLYEYKFVVNGNWQVDPDCQNWVRNPMGTLNSIVNVD